MHESNLRTKLEIMSTKKSKLETRATLKGYFADGERPTEKNFNSLIDAMINKADDGILKNETDGLLLAPESKDFPNVMSFSNKDGGIQPPKWNLSLLQGIEAGLGFMQPIPNQESKTKLFFNENGRVGFNTQSPEADVDVKGILGSESRIGTHIIKALPANGRWQDITKDLDGCHAFEVVAYAGKPKRGKYALLHATALSTFGRSRYKIRKSAQAHFGWWFNKISLRFTGDVHNYKLQIRTRSNYGNDVNGNPIQIKLYVTKLWDNDIMSLLDTITTHSDE